MYKNYTKHNLLDFINFDTETESSVNPLRCIVSDVSKKPREVFYLMNRNFRVEDNFSLNYALEKSNEFSVKLTVYVFLEKDNNQIQEKTDFIRENLDILFNNLEKNNIGYEFVQGEKEILFKKLKNKKSALIISDFNPLFKFSSDNDFGITFVDSFNIVPAYYADDNQAYNAASLRPKIYNKIYDFLTEFPKKDFEKNKGYYILDDFLKIKLSEYSTSKNNPVKEVVSRLSPFINFGFISSQRIALEVIKSDNPREDKETFLEELVIRKELSDNFCFYTKDFKSFDSLPKWAKLSLNQHKSDIRNFLYSIEELENSKTADALWNASQNQLRKEGRIHGYMRMYWAKMIANWSISPQEAIDKAIYLNDKYAFDAPSCNGYVGILWSIGGLHDRPFQDRHVTGKIRPMTYNGAKSKFDVKKYIKRYS